jgi:hypothetical protein
MIEWKRGLDAKGRIFTIGIDGDRARLFFPNEDEELFRVADGGQSHRLGGKPVKYMTDDFPISDFEEKCRGYQIVIPIPSRRTPGEYFPRIWLGPETPHPRDVGLLDAWIASVRSARSLFAHLRDMFRVIEPVTSHVSVYGHELRQLLILACTEVESAWKAILRSNGFKPKRGDDTWTRTDYLHLCDPLGLDVYVVRLCTHPAYGEIKPFGSWRTSGLAWYDAYNKVKHDREGELHQATLGHVIDAMAAVFVMIFAQFGRLTIEQDAYFNPDEFTPVAYPRGVLDPGVVVDEGRVCNPPEIGDWYIRPLPSPTQKDGAWPSVWRIAQHPRIIEALARRDAPSSSRRARRGRA